MLSRHAAGVIGVVVLGGLAAAVRGDDPPAKDAPVTLVDSAGKEIKLTAVRFTAGVRRLAWLAEPKGATEDARKGPLTLEVREPHSTTYQKGVVTLVPAESVEAIRYEYDKQAMAVSVKGVSEPVAGTLQYRGINVVGLEGDSGGVLGKFTGGVPGTGFKSVTFPAAKPLPARPAGGAGWTVQIDQPRAMNPSLAARNLKALYVFPGGAEHLADVLPVRKGDPLKLDGSLKKLEVLAVDPNTQVAAVEVTTGDAERVAAVPLTLEQDRRTGTLVGLVGEVDAGWKLFPLHAIKVLRPSEGK